MADPSDSPATGSSISHEDHGDDLRKVRLAGRLDMLGMEPISLKFTSLTASHGQQVLVDLRDVSFLASIGIRSIVSSARALEAKGGRMVLVVAPGSSVEATLTSTGISEVIPIHTDEPEALAALEAEG
jgi:anti-sigma B factor antagonist